MTIEVPTNEPRELRAGDTWQWRREDLTDYPASSWVLTYRFKNAAGGFEIAAAADGDDHAVTVAASTTSGYTAGEYTWAAQAVSGSTKHTVDNGRLTVLANLFAGTATAASDQRTHAQIVLAAVEAVLQNRATLDQMEYQIGGRMLKRMPIADLLKLRQVYKSEVANEVAAEKLRNGLGIGACIRVRL